jgi:hypothetical protein
MQARVLVYMHVRNCCNCENEGFTHPRVRNEGFAHPRKSHNIVVKSKGLKGIHRTLSPKVKHSRRKSRNIVAKNKALKKKITEHCCQE